MVQMEILCWYRSDTTCCYHPIFTYILYYVKEKQFRHDITDCNCNLENKENYLKNSEVGYLSNSKINITIFVDYI